MVTSISSGNFWEPESLEERIWTCWRTEPLAEHLEENDALGEGEMGALPSSLQ